jgi:hypothetical protein
MSVGKKFWLIPCFVECYFNYVQHNDKQHNDI